MEFNFDSEDNVKAIKTPAIKVHLTMLQSCGSLTRMYRRVGGEKITKT